MAKIRLVLNCKIALAPINRIEKSIEKSNDRVIFLFEWQTVWLAV